MPSLLESPVQTLPPYTPSPAPPTYTANVAEGERSLARTDRLHPNYHAPNGTLTRTSGGITVVLNEQDEDADIPSYGRHGVISGNLNFNHIEHVVKVTLKIKGKLKLSITGSNAVSKTVKTVDECYELWSSETAATSESRCPHSIPFSSILPSTFKDGDREVALPPSYEVMFVGVPSLFARCTYTLKVIIQTHSALLGRQKTLRIPVNYRPRKRPPQPILPDPSFLPTVKTSPEEWYQSTTEFKTRPSTTLGSIHAHLFIPAVRTFGLSDHIPFHIQFTGPISSLREFYSHVRIEGESDCLSFPSSSSSTSSSPSPSSIPNPPSMFPPPYHSHTVSTLPRFSSPSSLSLNSLALSSSASTPSATRTLRSDRHKNNLNLVLSLTLHRQISVDIKGQTVWKNAITGTGKLRALPPSFWSDGLDENEEASLDWEGEVKCRGDVRVGHFDAGKIAAKDFCLLSVLTKPNQSAFFPLKMAVPIAFVTDTWTER